MKTADNKQIQILASQDKRISLRCPIVIDSAVLEKDRTDGSTNVKIVLSYPEGATVREAVKSALLAVRITDSDGNPVIFADGENMLAKQVKFGEVGFNVGDSTEVIIPTVLLIDKVKIASIEVTVTRAYFLSGAVVDYLHGDFFPVVGVPVGLEKVFSQDTISEVNSRFGEKAVYVPQKLSPVVWRCTCGELCQDEVCSECSNTKSEVFGFFGDTGVLLSRSARMKNILKYSIVGAGIIVLLLIATLLIIFGVKAARNGGEVTTGSTTEATPQTTAPQTEEVDPMDLVNAYLSYNEFDSALAIAKANGLGAEVELIICRAAADYYTAAGNYEKAISYAEQVDGYNMTDLYTRIVSLYLANGDFENAIVYAKKLGDTDTIANVYNSYLNSLLSMQDYITAIEVASLYLPDSLESVIDVAIAYYIAALDYSSALNAANKSQDPEKSKTVYEGACDYYMSVGDYDSAITYAFLVGDDTLVAEVVNSMSTAALKDNYIAYYPYMTAARIREVLANTVDSYDTAAAILADGTVRYGTNQKYTPPAGTTAVSVACGEDHTLVLLSNGKVVSLGASDKKQNQTGGWSDIVQIAAGRYSSYGLRSDGTVVYCGEAFSTSSITSAVQISAGDSHLVALLADGSVKAVGSNTYGQCAVSSWRSVKQIAAGAFHTLALLEDGTVVACGLADNGRLEVEEWGNVAYICAGHTMSVALTKSGGVLVAGGTPGHGTPNISSITAFTEVACGKFGVITRTADMTLATYGFGAQDLSDWNIVIEVPPTESTETTEAPETTGSDTTANTSDDE